MKLGIMQPYFFPNLGHFSLIASVDQWVVFDVTQYTPKSWMNRNRVLHPNEGWNYISVPLDRSSILLKTNEIQVKSPAEFKKTVLGKLSHYKKHAPFYSDVVELVESTFSCLTGNSLVELNVASLNVICDYLAIPFNYQICSSLDIPLLENMRAGDWAPLICQHLGASEYVNPIGGRELFNKDEFKQRNIELFFLELLPYEYSTGKYEFESNLSILDVLMWNSPESIREKLKHNCKCVRAI